MAFLLNSDPGSRRKRNKDGEQIRETVFILSHSLVLRSNPLLPFVARSEETAL
jgi:hypothetical protein